jgi:hypothetical protein
MAALRSVELRCPACHEVLELPASCLPATGYPPVATVAIDTGPIRDHVKQQHPEER